MGRISRRIALAGVAAVLAVSSIGVATTVAGISGFNASCSVSGNSEFTVTRNGWYAWAWREGTTYLGGGVAYLRTSDSPKVIDTPDGATTSSKFGVVSGRTYDYPTCGA